MEMPWQKRRRLSQERERDQAKEALEPAKEALEPAKEALQAANQAADRRAISTSPLCCWQIISVSSLPALPTSNCC